MSAVRLATHAGSWYNDNPTELGQELNDHLKQAVSVSKEVKALIVPHAGYRFCARTAAWSWKHVDSSRIEKVFVLGPSHHKYMDRCALPEKGITHYQTPFGNIALDIPVIERLRSMNIFAQMTLAEDQEEHSIEMMLPFLNHVMGGKGFKLIPICVGVLNSDKEAFFAEKLYDYFADPSTLFVISSDFCHWGARFRYTYTMAESQQKGHNFNQAIEHLDRIGIDIIERQKPQDFTTYLRIHGNTICGRHPIGILLQLCAKAQPAESLETKFLHYSQSGPVPTSNGSCVAYGSLITVQKKPLVTSTGRAQ
uniref:AmmeMemoRadiSam system protein B n=1 Tax=Chromera velia CCMP2878 TaxID=1169474 RepID=A0A0G4GLN1_9ALVE|mmetsp:Transcript_7388/g.14434  ORF Transcript_7388/g.14434 Transcript_7388/m.14434 type:complete len:309 (+) Transcript_7388:99-1025(+)|eukprot:Cvel_22441.t1-p1 / transcript=Cvel_22441.t1 / gene=Cvel_22441 / organism=Chromera_velia_CCMP2878 / gene_product=Protein MEMO1, putative / transcript_product=Protein MEMO1, putative / location=Cvel_scaffold2205:3066-9787(+) / protein_length=308 / sequence_SO=supercontig / SO=protein_coding / is_pseudo=false